MWRTEATGTPFVVSAVLFVALKVLDTRRGTLAAFFIAVPIRDVTAMRPHLCFGYFCKHRTNQQ
jgi:hypothetical protein